MTQVGFNRMSSDIDVALPVFEKAVKLAGTASTHMNYGFCLMAKVFGVDAAQSSKLPATPSWAAPLDTAVSEFTSAIACDAGYAGTRSLRLFVTWGGRVGRAHCCLHGAV